MLEPTDPGVGESKDLQRICVQIPLCHSTTELTLGSQPRSP